jgi:hypothetical protein
MRIKLAMAAAGATALLAGCTSAPQPEPAPPMPRPQPMPRAEPVPPPAPRAWEDMPLTPGGWAYQMEAGASSAVFSGGGGPAFTLRCDRARRQVTLVRAGAEVPARIVVRTSYGARSLAAGEALGASDPLLDQIAFSRGRFTVEAPGLPELVLPAWPEPARAVEDCRA